MKVIWAQKKRSERGRHARGDIVTYDGKAYTCIQLFRGRLSDKVHATTPKGACGWF